MNEMQKAFEAILRIDGHTDFRMNGNKYVNLSLQTRWRWFQTGWEMRGLV